MTRFQLPAGYEERLLPADYDDFAVPESTAQAAVYRLALLRARELGVKVVVDLGCGAARKSLPWRHEFKLVLVDRVPIARRLQEELLGDTQVYVQEQNLERRFLLPVSNALIVCADVIEHLVDPEPLLESVREMLERGYAKRAIFSTPCRACASLEEKGPPRNPCHVREWRHQEFFWLLEHAGLSVVSSEHVAENDDQEGLSKGTFVAEVRRGE